MRERFDDYLYRHQAPSSPELLGWDEREARSSSGKEKRTRARNVVDRREVTALHSTRMTAEARLAELRVPSRSLLPPQTAPPQLSLAV